MSFRPPKGTDDVIAPVSQTWREVLRAWEDWSERYGYPLVGTPVFESTELFERGVGDTSEVVSKQMYTFNDKGGRSVTLRPEGTAGVVRAYLDSGQTGVWKGAYSGPFFRYERPQAGRRRQFWQVGVEYLDTASPLADVEVIELGHRFITAVGLGGLQLVINSIGDQECRPGYVESLRDYLRGKKDQLGKDSIDLIERNPVRVLDSKVDRDKLGDAPRTLDHLCSACSDHYKAVKSGLDALGIPYTEDPTLVRGLDYYTRTAFEYIATGLDAAQNAVGGGGRYDGLAEAIGGRAVPAVGFALGIDRIVLALGQPEPGYLDAYIVSETGPEDALTLASRLRAGGVRVDFDVEGRAVKSQFRTARRLGAPVVLVWKGQGRPVDVQTDDGRVELEIDAVPGWFQR
ncbi:MAG TPA: histidine--tRNA ligase [Acidimicrobiia bacterium]|jgi:histidyl-tRNA synthetase|nr:histidine--tRNA ligase [Acidimicrobiia bacterium]